MHETVHQHPVLSTIAFLTAIVFYKVILFVVFWITIWLSILHVIENAAKYKTTTSPAEDRVKDFAGMKVDADYTVLPAES